MGLGAEGCAGMRLWSFSRLQEGRPILQTRPNAMARCAPMSLRSRGWIATFLLRFHRALSLKVEQEQAEEILYRLGENRNNVGNPAMQRGCPCHRDPIPTKGIVSSHFGDA
jgi:hypothetical protein